MSSKLIIGVGSGGAAAPPPPPPPPPSQRLQAGANFQTHDGADPENSGARAREHGYKNSRAHPHWSVIEASKGNYSFPANYHFRRFRDAMFNGGVNPASIQSIFAYGNGGVYPTPATGPEASVRNPAWQDAFANYAAWLMNECLPQIRSWEVWNEWIGGTGLPNHNSAFNVGPAADFTAHFQLVKKVHAKKQVVDSSLILLPSSGTGLNADNYGFQTGFIGLGGLDFCDGMNCHLYRLFRNPGQEFFYDSILELDNAHNIFKAAAGASEVPIYITENACPDNLAWTSEDICADNFALAVLYCATRPFIKRYILYSAFAANSVVRSIWREGALLNEKISVPVYDDALPFAHNMDWVGFRPSSADRVLMHFRENGLNRYAIHSKGTSTTAQITFNAPQAGTMTVRPFGLNTASNFIFSAGANTITVTVSRRPRKITGVDGILLSIL